MKYPFVYKNALYRGELVEVTVPIIKLSASYDGVQEECYFMIDTGSDGTHINTKAMSIAGSKFLIPDELKRIEMRPYLPKADDMVKVVVNRNTDLTGVEDKPYAIGFLGTNAFKDYVLAIDYRQKLISLDKGEDTHTTLHKIDVEFGERGHIFFNFEYKGKKLRTMFDTGCGGDILLFEHRVDFAYSVLESDESRGANGAVYETVKTNEKITITDSYSTHVSIFKNHEVTKDFDFDGILGNNIFFNNKIYIDYPNKAFYTERPIAFAGIS